MKGLLEGGYVTLLRDGGVVRESSGSERPLPSARVGVELEKRSLSQRRGRAGSAHTGVRIVSSSTWGATRAARHDRLELAPESLVKRFHHPS